MIWHCPTYPPSLLTIFFFAPCTIATQIFFPSSHVSHSFLSWHLDTCCFSTEILYSQLPTSLANFSPIHMDIYSSREDLPELPKLLLKNTLSQPQVSFFHSTDIICYLFVYFIDQHWFCPPDCMHRKDEGHLFCLFVSLTTLSPGPTTIPGI